MFKGRSLFFNEYLFSCSVFMFGFCLSLSDFKELFIDEASKSSYIIYVVVFLFDVLIF